MSKKCKYYRDHGTDQYTPDCFADGDSVHPYDIEGSHCEYCGLKIKYKEGISPPTHTDFEEWIHNQPY